MTNKTELIDRILKIEWKMFSSVRNIGGRAPCQDDPKAFEIMRSSQFMSWSEDALESYLNDLKEAEKKEINLMTEKYARMMKSTLPSDYTNIKHLIRTSSQEILRLIDKIVAVELEWQEEFSKKFPCISGRGRPIHSREDTPFAGSIETYLRGELETYSKNTLELYYRDTLDKKSKNINRSEKICEYQVKRYGYKSLEEAEKALEKRRQRAS